MSALDEALERVVAMIGVAEAEQLLGLPVLLTIEGRNMLQAAISRRKEQDADGQVSLALGDARTLQGEVEAGLLKLWVHACPDCGLRIGEQTVRNRAWPPRCFECNGVPTATQTLFDGKPMVPLELPVRKLPDAFKHLDSSLRLGIDTRYIAKLVRALDTQRHAGMPVREAGGFAHNARIILRFAAERAGVDFAKGAVRVKGENDDARVTFYIDPEEGAGAPLMRAEDSTSTRIIDSPIIDLRGRRIIDPESPYFDGALRYDADPDTAPGPGE